MDSVFIENLSVRGKHGVSDKERSREQEFIISMLAHFDASPSAESDNINDTVDYNHMREAIIEEVGHASYHLLERLGETIATRLLKDERIFDLEVTIKKPIWENGLPGVVIKRSRG